MFGISIDSPGQNSAMIEKLNLPFPILSDPDRSAAIAPYGVADPKDPREIAVPAVVGVAPDGDEAFRIVASDFADRPTEDTVVDHLRALDLPPTTQDRPATGPAEPGPRAMPVSTLRPYWRGARFAAVALKMRHPEIGADSDRYVAQMDRYTEALKAAQGG